jgi:cytosine deaminase
MDLILQNARVHGAEHGLTDIGIADGRIAAIAPGLAAEGETIDLGGRLVSSGFVETHIHLDKSCILDRIKSDKGDVAEAIVETARAKAAFTVEDVYARAARTLEKSILQGTTHMRTHLEVDPGIGLRGFEGVLPLTRQYAWAIDLQICVFAQEGMLNNPGTEELMVEALKRGCGAVGGVPYVDIDPRGQIDRVFELAREYDVDIDFHLDLGSRAEGMQIDHVCRRTEEFRLGGRVAVGHWQQASHRRRATPWPSGWRTRGLHFACYRRPIFFSWVASTSTITMSRAASCQHTSFCITASTARCQRTMF